MTDTNDQAQRILVVEDDPQVNNLFCKILRRKGYQVTEAGEGQQALKLYRQEPADVVLLDNMNVETVVEAVRLTAGRAVLEVSGGLDATNVAAYARTGVDFLSLGALTHSAGVVDLSMAFSSEED